MGERRWHVGWPASDWRSLRRSPLSHGASAQDYPTRTVKIIVPFPAGGTADAMPRIVADYLSRKWGQPVIIENRAGAGGNVGAEAAYQVRSGRLHAVRRRRRRRWSSTRTSIPSCRSIRRSSFRSR